ncbi:MAG: PDZ domain-containing protein, partial [Bacillota bacterium]
AVASEKASVWDYIYVKLRNPDGVELESMQSQLPPGVDMPRYIQIMSELMEESKLHAQAAAFKEAGLNVQVTGEGAEVVEVLEEGSARDKLKEGDVIRQIDGEQVEFATDAVNLIRKHEIGDMVDITVSREGEQLTFSLETVEIENNPDKASIGVLITTQNLDFDFPRSVSIETENIIGPSAGGVFALEIYNQLVPQDITHGLKIAGTGTISRDGTIGKIDGVQQKVMAAEEAGADLFIAPEDNYEEASRAATYIKVISVSNFQEIISSLDNLEDSESVQS